MVGAFLGRPLLRSAGGSLRDSLLALLVGLLVLTIAFELPLVGTMIRLVVLCLMLGALSTQLYRAAARRGPEARVTAGCRGSPASEA